MFRFYSSIKNLNFFFVVVATTAFTLFSSNSLAQGAGAIDWDSGTSRLRFYDGSAWNVLGDSTIIGACSVAGVFDYDSGTNAFRFCDGTNWRRFSAQVTTNPCTAAQTATLQYDVTKNAFEFCNGTVWVRAKSVAETQGYFVFTSGSYSGASFGSLANANSQCVTNLTAANWLNKASAGPLNTMRVKAFLCDDSSCNNPPPLTTFVFATTTNFLSGGATFSTNSAGQGPQDALNWSGSTAFDTNSFFWSARDVGSNTLWATTPAASGSCSNWTSTAGTGQGAHTNFTDSQRWSRGESCASTLNLVCYINPAPDAFDFPNVNATAASTPTYSSVIRILGIKAPGTVSITGANGSPKFRICWDPSCSVVASSWATSGTIYGGQYLQLRMVSPNTQSTTWNATISVDGVTDTWGVTTTTAVSDTAPNAFSFAPTVNAAPNAVATSNIVLINGLDSASAVVSGAGSPQYRICADSNCNDVLVDWTTASNPIGNNMYVQLRATAGAQDAAAAISTLTIGGVAGNWSLTPRASPIGYFVLLGNINSKGNFGGMSGADDLCRSELTKKNWLGKGTIALAGNVKAFLCDDSSCNNAYPNYKYYFANTTGSSTGGSFFTANASGLGPNDSANWGGATYFGSSGTLYYWTGRAVGSSTTWSASPYASGTCSGFTNDSTGNTYYGTPNQTSNGRWAFSSNSCNQKFAGIICFVHPEGSADNFNFIDQTGLATATLVESNIVQLTGLSISGYVSLSSGDGSFQYRICSDANCTTVTGDWSREVRTVVNNDYIQVRMLSSGLRSTTKSATLSIGAASDTWSITTAAGTAVDDTPDAFTIPNSVAGGLDTYVNSNIIQVTGFDSTDATVTGASGNPQFRVCSTSNCSTVVSDWASGPGTVLPGQYIQLRIFSSAEGWTSRTATITMGSLSVGWNQTTGSTGFFILSNATTKGNLGGLSGANSWCLTELNATTWKGKANAGTLTSAKVRAFLCDMSTCQQPFAGMPYAFAKAGDATAGGTTMFVPLDGLGPGDTANWSGAAYFNIVSNIWTGNTGSSGATYWSDVATANADYNCNGWTSGGGGTNGVYGDSNKVSFDRWYVSTQACTSSNRVICMIDLDAVPDQFTFTDITNQSQNTLVTSNIVQINGFDSAIPVNISGSNGSPQYRICSAADCSTVVVDWTSGTEAVSPGEYVQVRLTTATVAGTGFGGSISISGVSDTFTATTSGTIPKGYFVMSNGGWNGNINGAGNPDTLCLNDLTANNWTGKGSAGALTASRVHAWLGDNAIYRLSPWVTYAFARSADTVGGGATFTTTTSGVGPGDSSQWSASTHFNSASKFWSFSRWAADDALWGTANGGNNCLGWANAQSQNIGTVGDPTKINKSRWDSGNSACNIVNKLICVVDPVLARAPTVSFTDLTGQATSTVVTSNIVQITGIDLPVLVSLQGMNNPQMRVCSDSSCASVITNWTSWSANSQIWIGNNQYLQLRITSSYTAGATVIGKVQVGDTKDEWQVTTTGTREQGYFVLSAGSWNGNLGGTAGADALCLTDLTNNNWMGKGSAGSLTSDRVKAFICDDATGRWCTLPHASTKYTFAVSGNATLGGASIVTDGGGQGPYDYEPWNSNTYFGGTHEYWIAFNSQTYFSYWGPHSQNQQYWLSFWPARNASTCQNWTSSSASFSGGRGISTETSAGRWLDLNSATCDTTRKLICMVTPDTIPNALSFTDLTNQATSTLVTSNIVQVTGTTTQDDLQVSLEGAGGVAFRYCDNSTCTGTNSGWNSWGGSIPPNYWLQLRTTTSSVAGTTFRVGVRVGNNTSPWYSWRVTTSGALPGKGYLVITESTYSAFQNNGLADHHSNCLSELNTKTWLGKASAGSLNSTRVKAFLCDSTSCGNLAPNTTFFYAKAGSATAGGDAFTTDAWGNITDKLSWARPTALAIDETAFRSVRYNAGHCRDWMSAGSGYSYSSNMEGITMKDDGNRWSNYYGAACGTARMACIVNP